LNEVAARDNAYFVGIVLCTLAMIKDFIDQIHLVGSNLLGFVRERELIRN